MATVDKIHTFVKYTGTENLSVATLPWLNGKVLRIWSPSGTGGSMISAGYNTANVWGGTLTHFVPDETYWVHAKVKGWELPAYLVKSIETDVQSEENVAILNMIDEHGKLKTQYQENWFMDDFTEPVAETRDSVTGFRLTLNPDAGIIKDILDRLTLLEGGQ